MILSSTNLELAEIAWDLVESETKLNIIFVAGEKNYNVCVETKSDSNIKIVRVFLDEPSAKRYKKNKYPKNNVTSIGTVAFGTLCLRMRAAYEKAEKTTDLSCVLTHVQEDGTISDVDVIWKLKTN